MAPDKRPMERVLGPEMGDFIHSLHESHGVIFHLEEKVASIGDSSVQLDKGGTINDVDLVVVGIGVRPRLTLAENAGLKLDRGVVVDQYLETSVGSIFAAGDIARWPDAYSGESVRIEHWIVAERQGQTAARNMLGHRVAFTDVPFFWSQHYDIPINYVGHAAAWDGIEIDGDINAKDCLLRFKQNGRLKAVASIFRDLEKSQDRTQDGAFLWPLKSGQYDDLDGAAERILNDDDGDDVRRHPMQIPGRGEWSNTIAFALAANNPAGRPDRAAAARTA